VPPRNTAKLLSTRSAAGKGEIQGRRGKKKGKVGRKPQSAVHICWPTTRPPNREAGGKRERSKEEKRKACSDLGLVLTGHCFLPSGGGERKGPSAAPAAASVAIPPQREGRDQQAIKGSDIPGDYTFVLTREEGRKKEDFEREREKEKGGRGGGLVRSPPSPCSFSTALIA